MLAFGWYPAAGKLDARWVRGHSTRILNRIPMQRWAGRIAHGAPRRYEVQNQCVRGAGGASRPPKRRRSPGSAMTVDDKATPHHPSSKMTIPPTISTIPASSSAVDRSRKKKYEATNVKTSSICPTART